MDTKAVCQEHPVDIPAYTLPDAWRCLRLPPAVALLLAPRAAGMLYVIRAGGVTSWPRPDDRVLLSFRDLVALHVSAVLTHGTPVTQDQTIDWLSRRLVEMSDPLARLAPVSA